jgi:hypothetical protein
MKTRRSFARLSGFRDASIIGIACEGDVTEYRYFEEFKERYTDFPSRIHIELIKRQEASESAPEYVISSIDAFKKSKAGPDDEFWVVIDYDRWGEKKLSEIAQQASQKSYHVAVSRPCFEAWLLLHWILETGIDAMVLSELEWKGCKSIGDEIRRIHGHYRKDLNDVVEYVERAEIAIENARSLDVNPVDRWPRTFGSRVYQICERIRKQ